MILQPSNDPEINDFLIEIRAVCNKYKIDLVPLLISDSTGIVPYISPIKRDDSDEGGEKKNKNG